MNLTPREHLDRYVAAINAGDADAVRDLLSPDVRAVDHRPLGWEETVGRDASMAVLEGWAALSPDLQLSVEVLDAGPRSNVARYLYHGVTEHGVKWETEIIVFAVVEGGRTTLTEMFPGEDTESALARFEEEGAQTR